MRAGLGRKGDMDLTLFSERREIRMHARLQFCPASLRCVCPLSKPWRHFWQITSATGVVDLTFCRRLMTAALACRLDSSEGFLRGRLILTFLLAGRLLPLDIPPECLRFAASECRERNGENTRRRQVQEGGLRGAEVVHHGHRHAEACKADGQLN